MQNEKFRIIFICLGNICRSCSAQTVMQHLVDTEGLSHKYHIDSAGIISYHQGERADARMRKHALRRGYDITHLSRPIRECDFRDFDLIIGMDDQNIDDLHDRCPSLELESKIHRMTEWCTQHDTDHVPDPYYGGDSGFENVLNLLEDACAGLLRDLEKR